MRVHGDIMPIPGREPISREEAVRDDMSELFAERVTGKRLNNAEDLDFAREMDEASRFRSNYFNSRAVTVLAVFATHSHESCYARRAGDSRSL